MDKFSDLSPIAIIGATRGTGEMLLFHLMSKPGVDVIGIGRNRHRMDDIDQRCRDQFGRKPQWQLVNVDDEEEKLGLALAKARAVVHCSLPRFSDKIVKCLSGETKKFVCLGSARKFTKFVDDRARDVIAAEEIVLNGSVPSVVLHPTMIYGGRGEQNVSRIFQIVRRLAVIPLPKDGQSLVQPIYCGDVVRCIEEALSRDELKGCAVTIAGPEAISYKVFVQTCARAVNKRVVVMPVPVWLAMVGAGVARLLPFLPKVEQAEMQRLLEDKDADIGPMEALLGVSPIPFEEGLAQVIQA